MTSSGSQPAPSLPPQVKQVLSDFIIAAQSAFGERLRSVVLFGSAAEGKLRPTSDVNVVVVLSAFEQARADQLRQPLRLAQSAIQLRAMFLLSQEVATAARSFAPKIADIVRRRVVLFGEDPFAAVGISREAEIRQLRQQLLNMTLRLRSAYVARGLREEQLAAYVAVSIGSLRSAAATLLGLEGYSVNSPAEAFERLGSELEIPNWEEAVKAVETIQDGRFGQEGTAQSLFFTLLDFVRLATVRVEALSDGPPRTSPGEGAA